jgi:cytidylate kinase
MPSIAIDGPAGAGKSTVSELLAGKLGFLHLDTGALYRAVAFYFVQNGFENQFWAKESNLDILKEHFENIRLKVIFEGSVQKMYLRAEDVTEKIRTNDISSMASDLSSLEAVRNFLLNVQRDFAEKNSIIMDGRDIGTVVLPFADVKIFLTAELETRAKRRYTELKEKGYKETYEEVLETIAKRDFNDSNRKIAPLTPAQDAVIVDTTLLSLDETVGAVYNIIKSKLDGRKT